MLPDPPGQKAAPPDLPQFSMGTKRNFRTLSQVVAGEVRSELIFYPR